MTSASFGQQQLLQQVGLPMVVPDVVARSQDLGPTDPDRKLHISVSMPYADPAGMAALVDAVSDPASPMYRKFLTPAEVGARFGLSKEQVQSVVDYLTASGFAVTLVGDNRLSILAEGTVAQAEKAFNTTIHDFQTLKDDEPGYPKYFSNTTVPSLPQSIAGLVIDISGLESFTKPQHRILNPTQTRGLYNTAPMYNAGTRGLGRTVGISNWDGFRLTNVPLYYTQYGLPAPAGGVGSNITVIAISGGAGAGTPGGEGDLDIQMVLGMAPLCTLRIYDGGSSDLIGVLTREVNDNLVDIASESYGWSLPASTATSAHNLHLSMSAQGITYMAASGDNGTTLEPYSYPNYEPEVLSVGGTIAAVNGSNVRTTEVGWSGSGGGWSTNTATFNTLPSWQHGTGVPTTPNKRLVPDVALNASGASGAYYFYFNGSLSSGSIGTSFACPVFAGSLAVSEQQIISVGGLPPDGAGKRRFGRMQNLIYAQNGRSDVWFDITSGANGNLPSGAASSATAGWDFVTGWGAINFNSFVTVVTSSCTAPSITTNPSNATTCAGTSTSFTVAASGTATLTYQWRKGGSSITGATNATYTIASPVAGDAGFYDCVVTNSCGNATSTAASLTVNSAPSYSTQPSPLTRCVGTSASFTVAAAGTPAPTLQWRKNGSNIAGATGTTFTIPSVAVTDASNYDCVATNSCGSATSTAVALTVNSAPSISTQPGPLTRCTGTSASFTIVAGGSPAPTLQWRKNTSNITGATGATLTIPSVAAGDAASYDCVVTNVCGGVTSNAVVLTVNVAPGISTQPSPQTVCAGSPASFAVAASGTPTPTFQWRKNTSNISGATSATYSIPSASAGNAGSYDCVITNACGGVTSNAVSLTVNTAPGITTQPAGSTLCPGDPYTFTVGASGTPAPTYQWRRNTSDISGATGSSFTIPSASAGDAGTYDCVVTNTCGSATSNSVALAVQAGPSITTQPTNQSVSAGASASFSVVASGSPTLTYAWRKDSTTLTNGGSITGADTATLTINPAAAGDVGSYDVVITNSCGSATSDAATLSVNTGCVADVDDGSGTGAPDGAVTIDDLLYYLTIFEQGALAADVDDGSGTGVQDGAVTIDDLLYYLGRFEVGC